MHEREHAGDTTDADAKTLDFSPFSEFTAGTGLCSSPELELQYAQELFSSGKRFVIARRSPQLIQPRSWNRILSCSAISSAVALALPSSLFLLKADLAVNRRAA
jgi:hypothetical protein